MLYLVFHAFYRRYGAEVTARKTFYQPLLHFIVDIALGIIDLPKFNCEDLEEIVAAGLGSFGVYW